MLNLIGADIPPIEDLNENHPNIFSPVRILIFLLLYQAP